MSAVVDEETRREVESDEDREAIEAMNNGKSIEDRADEGEHEDEEDDGTPQLVLPGTGPKLSTTVGGKKPTESYAKMRGISLPISGNTQIEKDTEFYVVYRVAADDVHISNKRKDGDITAVKRTHVLSPLGAPVVLDHNPLGDE